MADPIQPAVPALRHVMTIRAECAPVIRGGAGTLGERRHIQITGGEVRGPDVAGRILPGGSDWALVRPDGASLVSAHYTIMTEDGIAIYVRNKGLRVASSGVAARLLAGEPVSADEYYFRTTPVFEAPLGRLQWLNDRVFTARCERLADVTVVHVFEVQ